MQSTGIKDDDVSFRVSCDGESNTFVLHMRTGHVVGLERARENINGGKKRG
jgi:hypothetical protein